MHVSTKQIETWKGDFGREYTGRNTFQDYQEFDRFYVERYGVSRDGLNRHFLGGLPTNARILEVGCNIGNQLEALGQIGFTNLYGVEIQGDAVKQAHLLRPHLNVIEGSVFEIPFRDDFFDVVFTNNVLIHIAPANLVRAFSEMNCVTRSYIWGMEYFAPEFTGVRYRGHDNLLWKGDYAALIQKQFPDLWEEKSEFYAYQDGSGLTDKMYLLRKAGTLT
jgi:pseudaminic acid biosynthesis-associated methylase